MIANDLKESVIQYAVEGKYSLDTRNNENVEELLNLIKANSKYVSRGKLYLGIETVNELEYDIPENWKWVPLKKLVSYTNGYSYTKSDMHYKKIGYPVVKSQNIGKKITVLNEKTDYVLNPSDKMLRANVTSGDLLMVLSSQSSNVEPLGVTALYDFEFDALLNQRVLRMTPLHDEIGKYLYYFINSKKFHHILSHKSGGSAQANLKLGHVLEMWIALPPLQVIRRIVSKLDTAIPMINDLMGMENSLKTSMEKFPSAMRISLLRAAIKGDLTPRMTQNDKEIFKLVKDKKCLLETDKQPFDIPENWVWTTIDCIGDVIGGGTPKTSVGEYWGEDVPWLTPADMRAVEGKYVSKGKRNISLLGLQKSSARLMPKGSVVFSSRAPIGYCAIAENELSTNQGFKSIVPYNKEMSEYIYYYLLAYKSEIEKLGTGTTFKEVSGKTVKSIPFALPPLEEQKRIVEKLDNLLPKIDKLYT